MTREPIPDDESNQAESQPALLKEYELCMNEVATSMDRVWHSLTALGAVAIAVTLAITQIVPDDGFSVWFRVAAGWIGTIVIGASIFAWSMSALTEALRQQVARIRLLQLERILPLRFSTYLQTLDAPDQTKATLAPDEQAVLAEAWRGLPRGFSPWAAGRFVVRFVILVEVLLFAAAVLATIVLLD